MKIEISEIQETLNGIYNVDNVTSLNQSFVDKYSTEEQKNRDIQVTKLLKLYVDFYEDKTIKNKRYKDVIFWFCIITIGVFVLLFSYLVYTSFMSDKLYNLISVCITFVSLIIGILTIITKYVFPENDEEYITSIVEIIQKNDLENKKENIKTK